MVLRRARPSAIREGTAEVVPGGRIWPMRAWLTGVLVVPMFLALAGGCQVFGIPDEWCGLSAAMLWAAGVLALTGLWARPAVS